MVHDGAQFRTLLSAKARSELSSIGTCVDFTLDTVGAAEAENQVTATVFSLSVNDTLSEVALRDHPSGTFTTKCPWAERYGTNCVLSGMSPGGLLSAATGLSVGSGD